MANPNIPVLPTDIRFEDRGGCFVLVDPIRPEGRRDVATAWSEDHGNWRWRLVDRAPTGAPHPRATSRPSALTAMLAAYAAQDVDVAARLLEQQPRWSFGEPQIFRV